jgi:hypothetical protein
MSPGRGQPRRGKAAAVAAGAIVLAIASGCGAEGATTSPSTSPQAKAEPTSRSQAKGKRAANAVPASHCRPDLPSCRTVEGWVTYVEAVDPDGDGDAHFVVIDPQSITLPGLTAIDVRKDLRPHPLPGLGDLVSAAGPVQTGSHGQSQIHALELHVAH